MSEAQQTEVTFLKPIYFLLDIVVNQHDQLEPGPIIWGEISQEIPNQVDSCWYYCFRLENIQHLYFSTQFHRNNL